MSPRISRTSFLGAGLLGALSTALLPAVAEATEDPPESVMKKMVEAVKTKSYDAFLADADDKVRSRLTPQMFDGVSGMLGPRLRQGYKTTYLGKLRQQGHATYLWKLEFNDGKDDEALVKMSLKDGKVTGIWFQ